jgi:hypothetical protein
VLLTVGHDGKVTLLSCERCTGSSEEVVAVLRQVATDIEEIDRGEHT